MIVARAPLAMNAAVVWRRLAVPGRPAPLIDPMPVITALALALFVAIEATANEPAVTSAFAPRYAFVAPPALAVRSTIAIAKASHADASHRGDSRGLGLTL